MGNFTRAFTKHYDFDGDKVTVSMSRLKRKDALTLSPYMQQTNDGVDMAFSTQLEFMDAAANILPNCIKSVTGLIVDGEPLDLKNEEDSDLLYTDMYFLPLLTDILKDVMTESFATTKEKADVKKQQPNISEDSTTTNHSP